MPRVTSIHLPFTSDEARIGLESGKVIPITDASIIGALSADLWADGDRETIRQIPIYTVVDGLELLHEAEEALRGTELGERIHKHLREAVQ